MVICFAFVAFQSVNEFYFQIPLHWPATEYNFTKNPLDADKVELGRALFYDPILSRNTTISCASCHSQFTAFAHVDHALSHGINDQTGTRNAPALMNLAWQKSFMWDGAINHLDMQALAPISHPLEMDEKLENVVLKLQQSAIYPKLFYKAFGDSLITGEHTLKSISQFLLILVSSNSEYDKVMNGKEVFTEQESIGYKLFQKNCASCHQEPLFTTSEYENNGLPIDAELKDYGRMKISLNPGDSLKFKVPTLRNIEFSFPYMHDGRFKKLSEVLDHYTSGIQNSNTLSEQLQKPIALTSNEKVDLISFLLTLTDKEFLFNPKLSFPRNILLPVTQQSKTNQ
ncbi:MAG: c-type cytochrome [Bacteroidetes bacterium]|nr:c-type cytochrome [Bacteroidota bacterium]